MKEKLKDRKNKESGGFTLIELLVVVLVIGILAAMAVPQYFKVVEKGKVAEAFQWIDGVKGAQERYLARYGSYFSGTITSTSFDTNLGNLTKFTPAAVTTTQNPSWTITLARKTPCPMVYGCYTVTYAGPPGSITCSNSNCTSDLMPE